MNNNNSSQNIFSNSNINKPSNMYIHMNNIFDVSHHNKYLTTYTIGYMQPRMIN